MKTKSMFWLCLLVVTIFGVTNLHAQSNGVTLRFSANHTCAHSALDSILIKNLSQGGSTKLYYPDTVVTFVFTDIGIVDSQFQGLYVSQNYPNPFSETTLIDVFVPAHDQLSLSVYDLSGRQVCFINTSLDAGMHQFRFDACQKQAYLLVVNSRRHAQTRLMLQMGAGSSSQARITYEGTASGIQVKSSGSGFVFNLGDELRYTGYVTDFLGEVDYEIITDTPETDQDYLFDIANQVPQQPSEIVGDNFVCEGESNLIYEVEHIQGLTYLWTVPNDWVIAGGQGSHAVVVNAGSNSGDIAVVTENNCGTSTVRRMAITTGRNSTAPDAILGITHMCQNQTHAITLEVDGGELGTEALWHWYQDGCGDNHIGTGSSILVSPTQTTGYFVRAEGECNITVCAEDQVIVHPNPHPIATSNSPVCEGEIIALSVDVGVEWLWTGPGGFESTEQNPQITDASLTNQGEYIVMIIDDNGCAGSTVTEMDIHVLSAAPGNITGNKEICLGENTTLSVEGGELGTGASWHWYRDGCGDNHVGTGPSILVSPTQTTSYFVRAEGECNNTVCAEDEVVVLTLPDQPSEISGAIWVQGNTGGIEYAVEQLHGVSYVWTIPEGWEIEQGQGSHSVSIQTGDQSGPISVYAENACGISNETSLDVAVFFTLNAFADPPEGGVVSPTYAEVEAGGSVTITATPDEFWVFSSWSGNLTGDENPSALMMDGNKVVTATFDEFNYWNTYGSIEYGSLGKPNASYHFEGLGYVELNGKEYLILPFAEQMGDNYDFLRFFELDRNYLTLTDRTSELFEEPAELGFPKQLFIRDFNNDGIPDILIVDHGKEEVVIDGRFEGWYLQIYYGSEDGFVKQNFPGVTDERLFFHHAAVADYNNNGYLDILSQRWSSATVDVPGGNTISLLENMQGVFVKTDLESPPAGAGSVAFVDMDDGEAMKALAADYVEGGGKVWYWDIENNTTTILNEDALEGQVHDIIKLPIDNYDRLIFFGEQFDHLDSDVNTIHYSDDFGETIQPIGITQTYQGRDVFLNDYNLNGNQDVYLYCSHNFRGEGAWQDNFGTLENSFWLNNGDGTLHNPISIRGTQGEKLNHGISVEFIPLKKGEQGYEFIYIEFGGPYPKRFKLHELIIKEYDIKTKTVRDITYQSAIAESEVLFGEEYEIIQKGVIWGENINPTLEDNQGKTQDGEGLGVYTSTMENLGPQTTYFVRAYASSDYNTYYGEGLEFITPGFLPVIIYQEASDISHESATLSALINPNHQVVTVTFEYGLTQNTEYSIAAEPEIIEGSADTVVSASIADLLADTIYYFRVRAEGEMGVAFSELQTFVTLDRSVTDIDGNIYRTVIIGDQEWMAENLRAIRYNNGDSINTGLSDSEWITESNGAMTIYPHSQIDGLDSEQDVLSAYGALYNWYAVTDDRNICPVGWRVPTIDDWQQLVNYVIAQGFPNENLTDNESAGNALKSCRQVNSPLGGECNTLEHPRWNDYHTNSGFDKFGFSALPSGNRLNDGRFFNIGEYGRWWSASEGGDTTAWYRGIGGDIGFIYAYNISKNNGFSIRCIRHSSP